MRNLLFTILLLFCCLQAKGQDYLKEANTCFEKGDYECAKRNYTLFQALDGKDMSLQIQITDECMRALNLADDYFRDEEFEKASKRYHIVLEKNPKDSNAKKKYELCMEILKNSASNHSLSQVSTPNNTALQVSSETITFVDYTETKKELNIEMVAVQGGTFMMGCTSEQGDDCTDEEKPAHQVTVSNFHISKYEVTQAQWRAVMGNNPSYFKGDNLPTENVSWNDVQLFIKKLNKMTGKQYRLPTEAEWEYAARGRRSAGFKYSGSNDIGEFAWYENNANATTHPVGTKNHNELGIFDMSGNVCEWCSDWYAYYPDQGLQENNPEGPSEGTDRVFRGGGFDYNDEDCRVSFRSGFVPQIKDNNLGFRVARDN